LKNKEKLIEYGKKYYNERIYPKVQIQVKHGNFVLYFDKYKDYFCKLCECCEILAYWRIWRDILSNLAGRVGGDKSGW
jgi:hypothetical protein